MQREYHRHFSSSLQREMELLVFGHGGRAVLFFPTRMARFYDYENWDIINSLKDRINSSELQIFCVDSVDSESFYNKHADPGTRIHRHMQYEQYIINEVLPLMKCINGAEAFEVAGCSMGAYHALNLMMKYPNRFYKVVGMSGRYDLTQNMEHFGDLFDGYHDENIYYNTPVQYIINLDDPYTLECIRDTEITLIIGEDDPFLYNNMHLSDLLTRKNISHQLYIWDGLAHRPRAWRKMVDLYL